MSKWRQNARPFITLAIPGIVPVNEAKKKKKIEAVYEAHCALLAAKNHNASLNVARFVNAPSPSKEIPTLCCTVRVLIHL